jgi:iron complex outermembrane receptor protein
LIFIFIDSLLFVCYGCSSTDSYKLKIKRKNMSKFNKKLFLSIATAAVAGVGALNANAQLEEIIVTAQGRAESLSDVPVAVSVVSGEAMKDFGIASLQDMSQRLANVNISTGVFDSVNVRGIGSDGSEGSFQQSVGTFVDGVYRSRANSTRAAMFDLEGLEVLKGPQTTFFGANSIAGALNITTRKPGSELGYNLTALYGSDGEYNFEGGVDVPVSDQLAVRVAGRVSGMDGYITTPSGDGPETENKQVRFSARWSPSEAFTSDFRIDYADVEKRGGLLTELVGCPVPGGFAPVRVGGGPNACEQFLIIDPAADDKLNYRSDSELDTTEFDFTEIAWTNTIDLEAGQLIFKTGYYDHTSNQGFDGIPFPILANPVGTSSGFPVVYAEEYDQFSQEIRFQTDSGGFLDYMVGAYFSKSTQEIHNTVGFFFADFGFVSSQIVFPSPGNNAAPGDHVSADANYTYDEDTSSAFAAITLRPNDQTRINVSGRYTEFDKSAERQNILGTTNNLQAGSFVPYDDGSQFFMRLLLGGDTSPFSPDERKDKKLMPAVSLQYDINEDMMVYASFSEGFKAGGFATGPYPFDYDPEFVSAYEVGVKGSYLDGNLDLNLALFLNEFDDLQEATVLNLNGQIFTEVRNASEATTEGVELDGSFFVNDALTLTGSLAYLDSSYDSFPGAPCSQLQSVDGSCVANGSVQDLSGKDRPYAPSYSGNIGAYITMSAGEFTISVEPNVYFKGEHYLSATADPFQVQDAYVKADLRIALSPKDDKWTVALLGKNITDKKTSSFSGPITGATGSVRQMPDRGASIALQFSYNGF